MQVADRIPAERKQALEEAVSRRGLILHRVSGKLLVIRITPKISKPGEPEPVDRVFEDDPSLLPEEIAKKIEEGVFPYLHQ